MIKKNLKFLVPIFFVLFLCFSLTWQVAYMW